MSKIWVLLVVVLVFFGFRKANQSNGDDGTGSNIEPVRPPLLDNEPDPSTNEVKPFYKSPNQSGTSVFATDFLSSEREQYRKNKKWFFNGTFVGYYLRFYEEKPIYKSNKPCKVSSDKYKIIQDPDNDSYYGSYTLDGILLLVDDLNAKEIKNNTGNFYSFKHNNYCYTLTLFKLSYLYNQVEQISSLNKLELYLKIGQRPDFCTVAELAGRIKF